MTTPIAQPATFAMSDDSVCAICSQEFVDRARLACAHMYCHACIFKWSATTNLCPLCRGAPAVGARAQFARALTPAAGGRATGGGSRVHRDCSRRRQHWRRCWRRWRRTQTATGAEAMFARLPIRARARVSPLTRRSLNIPFVVVVVVGGASVRASLPARVVTTTRRTPFSAAGRAALSGGRVGRPAWRVAQTACSRR